MEENKLSYVVINQIKDFYHYYWRLTDEQKLLIDKLILNKELKERYIKYGLCKECKQPNTDIDFWCQSCNSRRFKQNFKNWTSGNHDINEFIQNAQLRAKNRSEVLEWIEYDKFENIKYLAERGFEPIYKATWKDGYIQSWDSKYNKWKRWNKNMHVALKCLHNLQNITVEFLREIESRPITSYHGIAKDPETNKFMIVMDCKSFCEECMLPLTTYYTWSHQSCNAKRFQRNFKNWTSGNYDIDEFIQNAQLKAKNSMEVLEWIEYDRFKNIKYLDKGGFGTTYKAIWNDGNIRSWDSKNNQWNRRGEVSVALKCLHNSQTIAVEFIREIESHLITNNSCYVVRCYGITKDPETNKYIMVMDYVNNGNLRQYLNNSFNSLDWSKKLDILKRIAMGLNNIHDNELIHHDLHCGNILNSISGLIFISDLGLCQPANVKPDNKNIYGVLPYVAPEVLRGKEYTQASDIYGFGIIAYEFCTGLPPYHDMAHEEFLAIRICQGLRPKSNYKILQLILDIIKQCWIADPLKRPNSKKLYELLLNLYQDAYSYEETLIKKQIKEAHEVNKQSTSSSSSTSILSYSTHPQAVYTSRLLNFKNLPEPKNADDGDDVTEYSESLAIDFTKLKRSNSKDVSSRKKRKIDE